MQWYGGRLSKIVKKKKKGGRLVKKTGSREHQKQTRKSKKGYNVVGGQG